MTTWSAHNRGGGYEKARDAWRCGPTKTGMDGFFIRDDSCTRHDLDGGEATAFLACHLSDQTNSLPQRSSALGRNLITVFSTVNTLLHFFLGEARTTTQQPRAELSGRHAPTRPARATGWYRTCSKTLVFSTIASRRSCNGMQRRLALSTSTCVFPIPNGSQTAIIDATQDESPKAGHFVDLRKLRNPESQLQCRLHHAFASVHTCKNVLAAPRS